MCDDQTSEEYNQVVMELYHRTELKQILDQLECMNRKKKKIQRIGLCIVIGFICLVALIVWKCIK